ncbi:hypothetical protein K2B91_004520 [Salmonella enterica subsp. enterica serovar Enteritidis]|nr:hypothetical protein [Salmonella enterica subsp. enterica serovar Enteritidis]EHX6812744.1 hypothetical protein [Salmonella enterica subsp. enterica serovar Enteritidis]
MLSHFDPDKFPARLQRDHTSGAAPHKQIEQRTNNHYAALALGADYWQFLPNETSSILIAFVLLVRWLCMSQTNIDRFDEIAGRVFADLYVTFPQPRMIKLEDYVKEEDPQPGFIEEWAKREARCDFVADTVTWLKEAGFITAGKRTANCVPNAILTPKGLECLKLTPNSLTSSAGKQLSEAAKSGSIELLKGVTNQVLSVGVALAAHKMGLS